LSTWIKTDKSLVDSFAVFNNTVTLSNFYQILSSYTVITLSQIELQLEYNATD